MGVDLLHVLASGDIHRLPQVRAVTDVQLAEHIIRSDREYGKVRVLIARHAATDQQLREAGSLGYVDRTGVQPRHIPQGFHPARPIDDRLGVVEHDVGGLDQYRHVLVGTLPHHVGTVLYTGILIGVRDDRHVGRRGHARPFPGRIETQGREIREETARRILTVYIKEAVIRPPLTVLDTGALGGVQVRPVALLYQRVDILETAVGVVDRLAPFVRLLAVQHGHDQVVREQSTGTDILVHRLDLGRETFLKVVPQHATFTVPDV